MSATHMISWYYCCYSHLISFYAVYYPHFGIKTCFHYNCAVKTFFYRNIAPHSMEFNGIAWQMFWNFTVQTYLQEHIPFVMWGHAVSSSKWCKSFSLNLSQMCNNLIKIAYSIKLYKHPIIQGGPDSIRQFLIINNQSIEQHTGKWESTFCCR
jgi:hypothetical protein